MSGSARVDRAPSGDGTPGPRGVLRLFSAGPDARVRSFYDFFDRRFDNDVHRRLLDLHTSYLNFGYWAPGCDSQDEASEALADRVADAAGLGRGDEVLDVGFGYAEQDIHWVRTREPARIAGINVSPGQVQAACDRVAAAGLQDRIELRVGSATALPFADGSFDRVVAVESAMHFGTRQDFFAEAFRVLRPGGGLATADYLPKSTPPPGRGTLNDRLRRALIPEDNWYPRDVYAERLAAAGFTAVDVRDVSTEVLRGHADYSRRRLEAMRSERLTRLERLGVRRYADNCEQRAEGQDYVIASARKPGPR